MTNRPPLSALALAPALVLTVALGCARDRVEVTPTKPAVEGVCAEPPPPPTPLSPSPAADRPAPTFQGKLLLPPANPGEARSELSGCLAAAPSEAEGARYPVALRSGAAANARADVRVNPMGRGVIVSHDLTHGCCLKAEVTATLEGDRLVMLEQLSGAACRCQCASTVRTAVGLAPGRYTLSVRQAHGGEPKVVHEEPFTVEAAAP
jgi:hypothetical protein